MSVKLSVSDLKAALSSPSRLKVVVLVSCVGLLTAIKEKFLVPIGPFDLRFWVLGLGLGLTIFSYLMSSNSHMHLQLIDLLNHGIFLYHSMKNNVNQLN